MKKEEVVKKKKKVSQKDFEAVVVGGNYSEVGYMLHQLTSIMRKMNRGEKVEDEFFALQHQNIDMLILRPIVNRKP